MTSDGDNRCPLCRAALWAPGASAVESKTCPRCGAELWALVGSEGPMFFLRQKDQSRHSFLAALAGSLSGIAAEEMEVILRDADSLDLVEVVLEIEDRLLAGRRKGGGPSQPLCT
jgi:hypothetical protein